MSSRSLQLALVVAALAVAGLSWIVLRSGRGGEEVSVDPFLHPDALVDVVQVEASGAVEDPERRPAAADPSAAVGAPSGVEAAPAASGRVFDAATGLAIAAAEVAAYLPDGRADVRATETDEQGAFRLGGLQVASYELCVRAPGWVATVVDDLRLERGKETQIQVGLVRGHRLELRVHGESAAGRAPVTGARVRLLLAAAEQAPFLTAIQLERRSLEATTDLQGAALLDGTLSGSFPLIVSADGFPVRERVVELPDADHLIEVELSPGGVIAGIVLRADGAPEEGAHVFLAPDRSFRGDRRHLYKEEVVRADGGGRFRFAEVPAGVHFVLAVTESGLVAYGHEDGVRIEPAAAVEIELRVPPTLTLRGQVRDRGGVPVNRGGLRLNQRDLRMPGQAGYGARLELVPDLKQRMERIAYTDPDGRFELGHVRAGAEELVLKFRCPGYSKATFRLPCEQYENREIDLVVDKVADPIGGVVVDTKGEPVPSIPVTAEATAGNLGARLVAAMTDQTGAFSLVVASSVRECTVKPSLSVEPESRYESEPPEVAGVAPGTSGLRFVLSLRSRLRGRVIDEDEQPVRAFELFLYSDVDGGYGEAEKVFDEQGRFELGFDRERDLFLRVCAAGFEPAELRGLELQGERAVVLTMRRGRSLAGVVLSASGEPVEGALVGLSTYSQQPFFPPGSSYAPADSSAADGSFRLSGIPSGLDGALVVSANRSGYPPLVYRDWSDPAPEPEAVEIRLPRSFPVRLSVSTSSGEPHRGAIMLLDERGRFLNPAGEPALQRRSTRALSPPLVLEGGTLATELAAGTYHLAYALPDAGESAPLTFEFTVQPGVEATYSFLVSE